MWIQSPVTLCSLSPYKWQFLQKHQPWFQFISFLNKHHLQLQFFISIFCRCSNFVPLLHRFLWAFRPLCLGAFLQKSQFIRVATRRKQTHQFYWEEYNLNAEKIWERKSWNAIATILSFVKSWKPKSFDQILFIWVLDLRKKY